MTDYALHEVTIDEQMPWMVGASVTMMRQQIAEEGSIVDNTGSTGGFETQGILSNTYTGMKRTNIGL